MPPSVASVRLPSIFAEIWTQAVSHRARPQLHLLTSRFSSSVSPHSDAQVIAGNLGLHSFPNIMLVLPQAPVLD